MAAFRIEAPVTRYLRWLSCIAIPVAAVAAGCGGETAGLAPLERDASKASDDGGRVSSSDAGHPLLARDAGSVDAMLAHDARRDVGAPLDAGVDSALLTVCFSASDAGRFFGCAHAACPAGTVCDQRDFDVTSTADCVGIPAACDGIATCACMGHAAQQCVEPGVDISDAAAFDLGCVDAVQGDASFLDFPCGCQ